MKTLTIALAILLTTTPQALAQRRFQRFGRNIIIVEQNQFAEQVGIPTQEVTGGGGTTTQNSTLQQDLNQIQQVNIILPQPVRYPWGQSVPASSGSWSGQGQGRPQPASWEQEDDDWDRDDDWDDDDDDWDDDDDD